MILSLLSLRRRAKAEYLFTHPAELALGSTLEDAKTSTNQQIAD